MVTINQSLSVLKNLLKLSSIQTLQQLLNLGYSVEVTTTLHRTILKTISGHLISHIPWSLIHHLQCRIHNTHPSSWWTVAINRHGWHKHSRLRPYTTSPTATSVATWRWRHRNSNSRWKDHSLVLKTLSSSLVHKIRLHSVSATCPVRPRVLFLQRITTLTRTTCTRSTTCITLATSTSGTPWASTRSHPCRSSTTCTSLTSFSLTWTKERFRSTTSCNRTVHWRPGSLVVTPQGSRYHVKILMNPQLSSASSKSFSRR